MPTMPPTNPSDSASALQPATPAGDWITALPPMLMVIGVVLLAILIMMNIRSRRLQGSETNLTARERIDQLKAQAAKRASETPETASSLDEIQTLAAQLNARSVHLERLIDLADERIAVLRELEGGTSERPASRPDRAVEPRTPVRADSSTDPLTRQVYELADANVSSVDIARRLQEEIGKVELILALRDQSASD